MKRSIIAAMHLTSLIIVIGLASCTKNDNIVAPPTTQISNPITSDTISGNVRGTLLSSKGTYYLRDSITVLRGDTLDIQAGVKLYVLSATGEIFIQGSLISEGTQAAPDFITVLPARQTTSGRWCGIVADSCKLISLKWTHIDYTGAPDYSGHTVRTIQMTADAANTSRMDVQDCEISNTADDGLTPIGGSFSILRCTFKYIGAPDGDAINVKAGAIGEAAYNVVWADGGNCIKLNSSATSRPTDVCIHNNTLIASGWRRVTELGYGVLVDASSRAEIFNNIIGDNYSELEITAKSDTAHVVYGNNLFFGTVDSLNTISRFYPPDAIGSLKSTDVVNRATSPVTGVNPQFVSYAPGFTSLNDNGNDYHLKSGSPALGKGLMALPSSAAGSFTGDIDLGAYTSSSNSHR